jgi:rSAM/selenodomain-associated transferase 1
MARRSAAPKRRASLAKHLIVMAKSPRLGAVKRRLAHEIGDVAALRFYRTCLLQSLLRLMHDKRWRLALAVTPDRDSGLGLRPLRHRLALLPQGSGDLGTRMRRIFAALPPGPVIIVGSDIPALRAAHVAEAFKCLGNADAVFGPALDGGYWLIGLKRTRGVPRIFAGVRWSSPHALADTLASLKAMRIAFAATLGDVDSAEDFRRERAHAERLISSRASGG